MVHIIRIVERSRPIVSDTIAVVHERSEPPVLPVAIDENLGIGRQVARRDAFHIQPVAGRPPLDPPLHSREAVPAPLAAGKRNRGVVPAVEREQRHLGPLGVARRQRHRLGIAFTTAIVALGARYYVRRDVIGARDSSERGEPARGARVAREDLARHAAALRLPHDVDPVQIDAEVLVDDGVEDGEGVGDVVDGVAEARVALPEAVHVRRARRLQVRDRVVRVEAVARVREPVQVGLPGGGAAGAVERDYQGCGFWRLCAIGGGRRGRRGGGHPECVRSSAVVAEGVGGWECEVRPGVGGDRC